MTVVPLPPPPPLLPPPPHPPNPEFRDDPRMAFREGPGHTKDPSMDSNSVASLYGQTNPSLNKGRVTVPVLGTSKLEDRQTNFRRRSFCESSNQEFNSFTLRVKLDLYPVAASIGDRSAETS